MIYALADKVPVIHPDAYVHPDATVIGAVTIGPHATVWPGAVLRGDHGRIEVGARTSIQDGTVLHCTELWPTVIGAGCVVGHIAHLEGCRVGDGCLIGSGSIVLNRAVVEPGAAVGAAALVTEDSLVKAGQIALGVPARMRQAPPDLADWISEAAEHYVVTGQQHRTGLRRIE
jgi:carbonic anhydrase/acetyltransferase-like protein (isoleucine patch superfamily)